MLLFKKKDLLVVISKSGETVQFTKPLKDILKYQHRYNYKFKMYENGAVTVADDYVINGETLTVLFGSAAVTYDSTGASYTEGSGGGSGVTLYGPYTAINNNAVTLASGEQLDYEFSYFLDDFGHVVVPPESGVPAILMNYFSANSSSASPAFTILYVSNDAIGLQNNKDSELVFPRNSLSVVFFSDIEFPLATDPEEPLG